MGRFSYEDVDNYGASGSNSYFSLKNDGDVARVRFMYNDMDDVEGYAVHQVEIDGKKRYVNCLRDYNEPKSKCPFCEAGSRQIAKLFIPLYDEDDEEIKIWERGKNFFAKISSLCARYSKDAPLVAHIFEIERHGKPHDTQTSYEIFETGSDNTRVEDLGEFPEILGTIILDKTADDMRYYLDNEEFPSEGVRVSRRNASTEEPVRRRTPARRSEEDTF